MQEIKEEIERLNEENKELTSMLDLVSTNVDNLKAQVEKITREMDLDDGLMIIKEMPLELQNTKTWTSFFRCDDNNGSLVSLLNFNQFLLSHSMNPCIHIVLIFFFIIIIFDVFIDDKRWISLEEIRTKSYKK